ncbi:hypothetical protein [Streptomyces prasinopilosus]|uniref:Uncharacterized protein n=1 Tax=Streptomyces prasinopilosus TaxID=67344 RepID=A0A1G6NHD0_9ACTN|nr:hypothetical protein [Streptomyces prasinopilosus]SDC67263.1 hypothetical protein SAMN05216505_103116 [Streptomyces prasinopilosus]
MSSPQDLSGSSGKAARTAFEGRWNALHGVRTLCAVAARALTTAAVGR